MTAADYIDCHYARTLADPFLYPSLEETISADVCVIGGGLAGIACAFGLMERGRTVAVLESSRIGWGASGRNGGFVLGHYALEPNALADKVGLDHARALHGLLKEALPLIRCRIDRLAITCHPVDGELVPSWYDRPGVLEREAQFLQSRFGESVEYWPRETVRGVLDTPCYNDALFFPDNFHFHPLNYLRGLAAEIVRRGGFVFEGSQALRVVETGDGVRVETARGVVKAAKAVYCTSAYGGGLNRALARATLPVRTYVMKTQPLDPDILAKAIRVPYAVRDDRWADSYYRILPDHSILWGGRVGLGKEPPGLGRLMIGDLLRIYPQLEGVRADCAWSGLMGYTAHKMPLIGKFSDSLWYCTNFGGSGLGPTTAGGEVIAAAITGESDRYKLFEPFGFSFTGGPLGPLAAQAVYHGWELGDRIRAWRYRKKAA